MLELNRALLKLKHSADGWRKLVKKLRAREWNRLADECAGMARLDERDMARLEEQKEELILFEQQQAIQLAIGGKNGEHDEPN